ncbi:hypothetical protein MKW94_012610 [Papaver nudicaule]|uniref:isoleucine--tRNA ligase n=1 Tax=Papaver nudicaule TaxID=74823 RepID=A0AA41VU93_PAPNU|nr:hypothetical protein [Papaver nudicaule]
MNVKYKNKHSSHRKYELLETMTGASLVGLKYTPLFDYFTKDLPDSEYELSDSAFKVVADNYVTKDSGTGVVHCAPAFGEDDYRVCVENKIIQKGEKFLVAVDDDGRFTKEVSDFCGRYVKDADKDIIAAVKEKGRLVKSQTLTHSYPLCYRSDTPLIYKEVPSWFIAVEKLKNQLLENTRQTYGVHDFVKEKRFHNCLENARDWVVSRSRYWGTPLPIWISDDDEERVVTDLQRHKIDHMTIPSSRGPEFGVLRRVEDVFDCWFESGSMPHACVHYLFENVDFFENNFPGNFVAEGLDQTRGWFYTLMVLSTALFEKPAFTNLICNGLVLAEDGKKMSKSLKNYPPPTDILDDYGADALRLYLINSPVVRAEPLLFKKEGVHSVVKDVFFPWYNAYRFLVQNARRFELEGLAPFVPIDQVTIQKLPNVLDQWINSATESLVHFVRQEMDAYRLYTVVPYILKFIDNLTNIYVRFNRKRLKGGTGEHECNMALSTLDHVLLTTCKAMSPFTPILHGRSEAIIHYCSFPQAVGKTDERIERSVTRMMTVIDLGRMLRERHNKPLKAPLREMVVVHPDPDFLEDIGEKLREYVLEELYVRSVVPCNDKEKIQAMTQEYILHFESVGEVTIEGHCLKLTDIKVIRVFKRPESMGEKEMDATGDSDVLVILDLCPDKSLFEAGVAHEIVNRIQKLRKIAGLEPTDKVQVYCEPLDGDKSIMQNIVNSHQSYIKGALGSPLLPWGVAQRPISSMKKVLLIFMSWHL